MPKRYFDETAEKRIIAAIQEAEARTSGEIMVHIETRCPSDALSRGLQLFRQLGVDQTKLHNGVLIYAAINDRRLAIIADTGINAVVAESFWEQTKAQIIAYFLDEEYTDGLVEGICLVGDALAHYFPVVRDQPNINQLPDEISFGQ
ncbi:MAG: TPM domain-containing protein [Bernardetiaceae bacterium]